MRIVITGCSRGIGLELVRQYSARGERVEAGARSPAQAGALVELSRRNADLVAVHPVDVADPRSVAAFAAGLAAGPVDLLINNAGVSGKWQGFEDLDWEDLLHTFSVNALGALRVTRALLPRLRQSQVRKVVHISSRMGSIDDNTSGGAYAYRMSKAALNMASRSLAADLKSEHFASVVLHPGWVKTDMGGAEAPLAVEGAVASLVRTIDGLTPEDSGKFLSFDAHEIPW
jgi:NAD(P)-dependent dehydrogenase (short-subunit alcohol dehydrogenase family)